MTYLHSIGSLTLALAVAGCSSTVVQENSPGTGTGATGTGTNGTGTNRTGAGTGGTSSTGTSSTRGAGTGGIGSTSTSSTGGAGTGGTAGTGGAGTGGIGSTSTGGTGGTGTGAIGFYPSGMVLDGHDVVLEALTVTGGNGVLIRTTPGGGPVVVLAGGTSAFSVEYNLVADAQNFYFPAESSNGVSSFYALARSGGAPVKLADTQANVLGLAVDSMNLYWVENIVSGPGTIKAVPLAGGTPVVLASNPAVTGAIAVDASNVYWGTSSSKYGVNLHGSIVSVPLTGGAPTTLMTGLKQPIRLAVDGATLVWLDRGSEDVNCMATDGQLGTLPAGGGQPVVLVPNIAGASDLEVAGGSVYFSFYGQGCNSGNQTGIVAKVSEAGGAVTNLAMTHMTDPQAIVVDGAHVDYTTVAWGSGEGAVLVAPN